MSDVHRILVRAPNWVGDVVMATPAFRCIRKNFRSARISVLLKPYVKLILKDAPWFDEFIEYGSNVGLSVKGGMGYCKLTRRLKAEGFDLGFLLPNSFSSALMFKMAGIKKRIGYIRDGRGLLLTDGVNRPMENGRFRPTYMADYYLKLCYSAGCVDERNGLELFVSEESEAVLEGILTKLNISRSTPLVLVNPGAAYGSSKCWTADGFADTIDMLNHAFRCNILLVSGPSEMQLADDIALIAKTKVFNLSHENVNLDILKPLVKMSSLLLTVDSGPRHYAVAFKTPTVVLMGPTDPRYTETDNEIGSVIREDVDCGPCHKKVCPVDHKCMKGIDPQVVFDACAKFMKPLS